MRAQISMLPLLMAFLVVSIVAVAFFLTSKSSELEVAINEVEFANLKNSLQNRATTYASQPTGSAQTFNFNVPEGMEKICFVDKNYDEFAFPDLAQRVGLEEGNVYFFPNEFGSATIKGLVPRESPLCIKTPRSVPLRLTSQRNGTEVSSAQSIQNECKELLAGTSNINVAFLGVGFDDAELTNVATGYIESVFKSITPFKEHINSFNFYQVNGEVSDCRISHYIDCNTFEIEKRASVCPNDFIIVLVNRNTLIDLTVPIRSSAVGRIAKINTADRPEVLAHEFAHVFADLADEYVDVYYEQFDIDVSKLPNCDERNSCTKWDDLKDQPHVDCFKGCTTSQLYRPTPNSIMNEYWKSEGQEFWAVNEQALQDVFETYN